MTQPARTTWNPTAARLMSTDIETSALEDGGFLWEHLIPLHL